MTLTAPTGEIVGGVGAGLVRLLDLLLPWCAAAVIGLQLLAASRHVLSRVRHRRLRDGARLVTVLAPPQPDPEGAAALWGNLAGLLRPLWRRLLFGQPHLCFEYHLAARASTIRIWVPGPIPPK